MLLESRKEKVPDKCLSSKGENKRYLSQVKPHPQQSSKKLSLRSTLIPFLWWEVILAVIHDNNIHDVGQERPGTHQLLGGRSVVMVLPMHNCCEDSKRTSVGS